MDIYSISKKDLDKYDEEFAKTAIGKKAKTLVLVSILMIIVWAVISVGAMILQYVSWSWGIDFGFFDINILANEPLSYFLTFLMVVLIAVISTVNYNREFKAYLLAKKD